MSTIEQLKIALQIKEAKAAGNPIEWEVADNVAHPNEFITFKNADDVLCFLNPAGRYTIRLKPEHGLVDLGPEDIEPGSSMSTQPLLEERLHRTVEAVGKAMSDAQKYNDFGSVLGAQDESMEIYETLMTDLGRSLTRARRLSKRILRWNEGDRTADLL